MKLETDNASVVNSRITSLICLLLLCFCLSAQQSTKIKGVCWVAGDSITHHNFDPLIDNNVEWISQTPFAWMSEYNNTEVRFSGENRGTWGGSDAGLIHTTQLAHHCGMKVILKPHIWLHTKTGKWRSDIAMESDEDWKEWFANYEKMIIHYAKVAEKGKMDALCIGTELLQASTKHPDAWRSIIKKIRSVYSGQLTYAGNFYKEYDHITFWDDLDFIGVQAYFPLTDKKEPSIAQLRKAWKKPMKQMARLSKKYNKPIVFTEVGYRNTIDAAKEPWLWPRQVEAGEGIISEETQAICYQALFEALWQESWFGGVYIWKWFHGGHSRTLEEYFSHREERMKRRYGDSYKSTPRIAFSPQMKQAEKVMAAWFAR